ncbi:MAG: CHASE2 domain-containing protein [Scytolyngbya sp. HA4215-MV1]|nr:CHASE2 domain-containing protein [Scytolyngbya sp. HA4215-MV1]
MRKLVVLKLGEGSFEQGFPVSVQIGNDGDRPSVETSGKLPPNPLLARYYANWQETYRSLGLRSRLQAAAVQVTNVSLLEDCQQVAREFHQALNLWIQSEPFRPVRERLLEKLLPTDEIRVILQTEDRLLQRLPWHLLDWFERYPKAELAISAPNFEQVHHSSSGMAQKVKILAILGNGEGIDIQADRALLEQLPEAEVTFLVEPQRKELTDALWEQSWHILFFAGHSSSQSTNATGQIFINQTDSLTISQLKFALRKAVERGLNLAIFNSCDGLGLAWDLADLQIPEMIVMREPVPDRVAQEFLKYFLASFSQNEPFYRAVREARERLQGLEDQFPCATWLPIICQNPAEIPPTWKGLCGHTVNLPAISTTILEANRTPVPVRKVLRLRFRRALLVSLAVGCVVMGTRQLGLLQPLELKAFDQMVRLRPQERPDPRLVVITIDDDDYQTEQKYNADEVVKKKSLSDRSLSQLLSILQQHHPRVIGLDLYRDFQVASHQSQLVNQWQQTPNLIGICKGNDASHSGLYGTAPPPNLPPNHLGFSDFVDEPDGVVRRVLLSYQQESDSICPATHAFSVEIAKRYLEKENISLSLNPDQDLQVGKKVVHRIQGRTSGYQRVHTGGTQILLNYRADPEVVVQVPLRTVLAGQLTPNLIKDRIVLIGSTHRFTEDHWATPYTVGATPKTAGVFLQAQMVSNLLGVVLDNRPLLWVWHPGVEVVWLLGWSLVSAVLVWRVRTIALLMLTIVLTIAILFGVCLGLLLLSGWVPFIPAALILVTTSGVVVLYEVAQAHQTHSALTPQEK